MEDRLFLHHDLLHFREHYYLKEKSADLSRRFFISRWNKMYRLDCVKEIAFTFERCKNISLGEDAIFTYLLLLNSKKGKTLKKLNSYYYNLGNPTSMTKLTAMDEYVKKARRAFELLRNLLLENGNTETQAYALYFILIESLFYRQLNGNLAEFSDLYLMLTNDEMYRKAMDYIMRSSSVGTKLDLMLRKHISIPQLYVMMKSVLRFGGKCMRVAKLRY
jgi:hypothetical protein